MRRPVSPVVVILSMLSAWFGSAAIVAADTNFLGTVWIADKTTPANQLAINSSGQASVVCSNCSGSGVSTSNNTAYDGTSNTTVSATAGAEALTAAPSLTTGRNYSLFMDLSGGLRVNCQSGCAGGTFNNNSDNVATSASNGQSAAWLYGWDGSAWDRMPGTSTTGLTMSGSGTAGTAASGVLTVQGIASMTPVQVSQATAASLNATVVGTGTFVTQSTVTNAGTFAVQGDITKTGGGTLPASGVAAAGVPLPVGGDYNSTLPTVTNGQRVQAQFGTRGSLNVTLFSPDTATGINALGDNADAVAVTGTGNALKVFARASLFNGTSWDRFYSAANALNSTGTGLATAQIIGQCDDTTPTALTENQFGNLRMDCTAHGLLGAAVYNATPSSRTTGNAGNFEADLKGSLRVSLMSNDTTTALSSNTFADGASMGTGLSVRNVNMFFNGATYDRQLEAANALNSTGTGLATAQTVGQCDDTSPQALTENSFGNMRVGCADHTLAVGGLKSGVVTGLSLDASGYLQVNVAAGGASGGTSSTFGAAFPATGTAAGMSQGGNMVALTGTSNNLNVNCASGCTSVSDIVASGNLTSTASITSAALNGVATAKVQVTGTWVATLQFEGSVDGTNYFALNAIPLGGGTTVTSATANGNWDVNVAGLQLMRVRASAYTSGTVVVTGRNSSGAGGMFLVNALPTGTNSIGAVTQGGTWTDTVTQATAANLNATVVGTGTFATQAAQSGTWNITNVSGTVSLPTGASTSAKQPALGTAGTASTDVITVQGIASMTKLLVTPDSVALPANQSVNVSQINAVTPLMGNGTTGTGSQRVTIASDNTAFSVNAVQSGTWTVQPGNTANTTAWLVNGAVTPADAKALGTTSLGTYSYTGIYNGTTIDLLREAVNSLNSTGVGLPAAQIVGQCDDTSPTALTENSFGNASISCADHSQNVGGNVTTAAPSYTTATTRALSLTTAGALRVDGSGVTQPVSGTVSITANSAVNVAQVNGVTTLMGNGVTGTGSQRVTIASDNTAFSVNSTLQTQTDTVMVGGVNLKEINAVTPLMGNGVTGTGSMRVTLASDTTSNSNPFLVNGNVTPADDAALGTTSIRQYALLGIYDGSTVDMLREVTNGLNSTGAGIPTAGLVGQCDDTSPTALTENSFGNARVDCATHAQLVTQVPSATAGGTTIATITAANSTNATNLKASAGMLYGVYGYTISATAAWVSFYNTAGTPTCGTSIIEQHLIPGSASGAGFVIPMDTPHAYATGIGYCITTGIAGTGSVAASSYVVNFSYK